MSERSDQRDLRSVLKQLEQRGKVYRFREPIDKDTELLPVYRVQQRGLNDSDRKVLLFENVVGAQGKKYEMSVAAGIYGASEEILALGMGCEKPADTLEKWHHGMAHPLPPVLVEDGPVDEEIHTGDDIKRLGLDELPIPVEEPGFSGMLRTGLPMITKDPETGVRNVGTYNAFARARDRMVAAISTIHDAVFYHWRTARRRGEGLPVAIVIGGAPEIMLVGSAHIPYGADELAVAGGIAGAPVELVRCKTIPLEVPAHAECIIEGIISTETVEPRLPFGEYPGYINVDYNVRPVMQVTAITHRKDAMFTPVLVGFPPSDTNAVWGFCQSAMMYEHLRYGCRFAVDEVYCPQTGGGNNFCILRLHKGAPENVWQILQAAAAVHAGGKFFVAVDSDIDVRNPDLLIWALSFSMRPEEDISIIPGRSGGLDPSAAPTGSGKGKMESARAHGYSRVLIDATRKWPYPPVALPKKEYMERALAIWSEHGDLPAPNLRQPWYGYTLGHWDEKLQHYADLIAQGEYLKVGEEMAKLQEKVREEMIRR
jgi:UbiD family decarboxylase